MTRVTVRIFSSNKEQIGPIYEAVCDPKSPSLFARYNLKAEIRASGSSGIINATATMLIRIDTLDSCNLQPVAVGYACCKLFCCAPDRLLQPKAASKPGIYVNKGAFQLRLRAGRISPSMERFSEMMLSELTVIPCASVLVRIFPTPKSADGISTLSRDVIPRDKWQSLGLMQPAPRYDVGGYCGMYAEPSDQEWHAFDAKAKLLSGSSGKVGAGRVAADEGGSNIGNPNTVINAGSGWEDSRQAEADVLRAMDVVTGHGLPVLPPPSVPPQAASASFPPDTTVVRKGTAVTESPASASNPRMRWWKSLLPAPDQTRRTLDYTIILPYSVEVGINLELVGINHFPADHIFPQLNQSPKGIISGLFSSTVTPGSNTSIYLPHLLTSLSHPPLLYTEPSLFDAVQVSRQWDLQRPMNAPRCLDGYLSFSPAVMSARMYAVVDVRLVEVTLPPPNPAKAKGKSTSGSDNSQAEVFKSAGRLRQYWTMLPLACERSPGLGHFYVASKFMASPLFEGPVPIDGLLTSADPYKELIYRLKQGVRDQMALKTAKKNGAGNSKDLGGGRGIRLSDGASLMVRVLNPLLRDLIGSHLGISRASVDNRSESTSGVPATGTASTAVNDIPPDMTYMHSLLAEAEASPEMIDNFTTYIADRDVQLAMDQWKNNARDTSLNARDAAARVTLAQLVPKLPGAAGESNNVVLIAHSMVSSAHNYFVQDIGWAKK